MMRKEIEGIVLLRVAFTPWLHGDQYEVNRIKIVLIQAQGSSVQLEGRKLATQAQYGVKVLKILKKSP